ncbi:MAG: DUF962 domain-containing protein [Moraxellaceae bacterium]|nr:DUF962 domain-containing protein [Moraxellaceae bacterium]
MTNAHLVAVNSSNQEPKSTDEPQEAATQFSNFAEFYPFYLSQHQDKTCRRLHFVGSTLGLLGLGAAVVTGKKRYVAAGLVAGYGCAWVGHFFFEHNKPATFKYPLYSFMGDCVMYKDMIIGKIEL